MKRFVESEVLNLIAVSFHHFIEENCCWTINFGCKRLQLCELNSVIIYRDKNKPFTFSSHSERKAASAYTTNLAP